MEWPNFDLSHALTVLGTVPEYLKTNLVDILAYGFADGLSSYVHGMLEMNGYRGALPQAIASGLGDTIKFGYHDGMHP